MKSIKQKILFSTLSIVVAIVLIAGSVSTYFSYRGTYKTLEQTLTETAKVAADRVAQEIHVYRSIAAEVGKLPQLSDPEVSSLQKKALIDQRAKDHGFQLGNILLPNGDSIFEKYNYSDTDYFKAAMQGEVSVSEPIVDLVTGELVVTVAAPIWKYGIPGSGVAGVVYFVPVQTFLNDIADSINVSENGYAQILNASGLIIADPDLEKVKSAVNVIEQSAQDPSLAERAEAERKMIAGENGLMMYKQGGRRHLVAYAPIPNTAGWSIGIHAPLTDFLSGLFTSVAAIVAVALTGLIAAVFYASAQATSMAAPILASTERLRLLSQGDLHTPAPQVLAKDETGVLANSTQELLSDLSAIIRDIVRVLFAIADGKLNIRSDAEYKQDFLPIRNAVDRIISALNQALLQINISSDQVAVGAEQVSTAAQTLAQGAQEQVNTLEALSATVARISQQVGQNAQSAEQALQASDNTSVRVEQGNRQMQALSSAMAEIGASSERIKKIIKDIEDIAFQTNILALNAAVEAARAGEAGKGFAVVADEVRNLASKSAQAAQNTARLIEESIQLIGNGEEITQETVRAMEHVVEGAKQVNDLIGQIAIASGKQADEVKQLTQGIAQISDVVQQSAATTQESAAAAEQLSGQAQMLKSLAMKFELAQVHTKYPEHELQNAIALE